MSFLEIVFVGQREVFVCLDFCHFFFFPLAMKVIGLQTGCHFFKKCRFFLTYLPLRDRLEKVHNVPVLCSRS